MYKFWVILILSTTMFANIAFSDNQFYEKQLSDFKKMDDRKLRKMEKYFDLDADQKIAIKSIMEDSFIAMKESKSSMKKSKDALMNLDPNNKNFKDELLNLSNKISGLVREQTILQGEIKYKINNQLNDDQKELAKAFSRIEKRNYEKDIKWKERGRSKKIEKKRKHLM